MFSLHEGRKKANLGGVWKYAIDEANNGEEQGFFKKDFDFSSWKDIEVPNNWYLTEIGDYFGTIWFKTEFEVPSDLKNDKLFIRFEAVDYFADVWLNGEYLGFHEGMFNSFEFDITDKLNDSGANILVVKDGAPRDETEYIQADFSTNPLSTPYKLHQAKAISQIKGHMIDAMHRPGAFTKFRQDGNSGGIWGSVELVARPDIYIDYFKIYTKIGVKKDWLGDMRDKRDGTGIVSTDITIQNTTGKVVKSELNLEISPYNFESADKSGRSRAVTLQPGTNVIKLVCTVENAHLWWTWDQGNPDMYTATVKIENDEVAQNFGIKEVERDEKTSNWYLNGRKVFIRGMRYISSQWMSEANEEMWKEDLTKMLDFDINSIRIGSHVEPEDFYTMCDEMGYLVWQVFPLHYCVDDSDDFIDRASDMIRDMGLMLCNHASIGMWSVFKEPEIYQLPDKPNNYFRLCEILKETLGTVDPVRWIHKGDYREGVQNIMLGCTMDGDKDLNVTTIKPDIVEFGSQSIPVMETLKTFIPEDKLWPPHWDTWEYWGLFYDHTFDYAKIEMGNSLEEFIDNYQTYEAFVVKEQIEYLRQRKYAPVGSMYLYYWSDSCPMIGSGLLDYYRRPYKVYDSMKAVYQRVLISLERFADPYILGREKIYAPATSFTAKVWLNNDFNHPIDNAEISWKIVNRDSNETVADNNFTSLIATDSAKIIDHIVWEIPHDAAGLYRVEMNVTDSQGNVLCDNHTDFTVR